MTFRAKGLEIIFFLPTGSSMCFMGNTHGTLIKKKQCKNKNKGETAMTLQWMKYIWQAQEISHLIACQPVALKAVRLQALVPPHAEIKDKGDLLDKFSVRM